jgi:hypothetical protein
MGAAAPGCDDGEGRDAAFDQALEAHLAAAAPAGGVPDTTDLWGELAVVDRAIARIAEAVGGRD